ncbi:hypothetical protein ACFC0K_39950, partial [Streptomyces hydrogenans]
MGTAKRPGRPWAAARGPNQEINDLVQVLREWLDGSSITVRQLHSLLTEDHFGGTVPVLRRLRAQLNGEGLTLELAEAVADICFPEETGEEASGRIDRIRSLWTAGCRPSQLSSPDPAHDLVKAQQRTIEALEDLNRLHQAYEVSEQARLQALQAATLLFALLGQTQAQVAQLTRQLDAIRSSKPPQVAEETQAVSRLVRAQSQTEELRVQLARAEAERDRAQQVADLAARQITQLEAELSELRPVAALDQVAPENTVVLPGGRGTTDDLALDQVDAALTRVRSMLDREHKAVQIAAEDVGWEGADGQRNEPRVVVGETISDKGFPNSDAASAELFRTTPHNPPTSSYEAPPLALPTSSNAGTMRFVGAANRRIARGLDLDEIVLGLCRATVPTFSDEILVY